MARCVLTGKRAYKAKNVSHSNRRTRKWQLPNVHYKRIWVPELGRMVRLPLSARALRTVSKVGLLEYARQKGIDLSKYIR